MLGVLADYLGRARTLVITILIYAVFTGLAGFSHSWWELAIYRFLTALGVGGEWASGATGVVGAQLPESWRVKGAGILLSAWGAGDFLAAGVYLLLSGQSWPGMFFVGILPALVGLFALLKVHEPERWRAARPSGAGRLTLWELFDPARRRAHRGRFRAGVRRGLRALGRDQLDAVAGP